jgi:hypothetical protein
MADYQLTATEEPCAVIRTSDGACIPPDMANRDYNGDAERPGYIQWKEAGNVPDPYVAPPPPEPVQDANVRLDAGILAAVGTVMTARDAIHAIPNGGAVPPRLDALLLQMKVTMDAFVSMLQAQANT